MTVSRRILVHVALGLFFVVAVTTAVTYTLVYDALKHRDLRHLNTYIDERAQREEARFQQVQSNLKLVRGQFLKRLEVPMPDEVLETKWDYWYRRYPDGAWRSREAFGDARKTSSMWADKEWPATREMRRQTLIAQELCDEMLPGWTDTFPSFYFQFPGPGLVNVGVDILLADWSWKMPAHFDTNGLEWIAAALPGGTPPDRFSWTGLQQDDVVSEPLVCIYLPVVKDGVFLASVGHNMAMSRLIDAAAHSDIPGVSHYIFRPDGRLIAHPAKRAEILKSKGLLTAQDCGDTALKSLYFLAISRPERRFTGFDPSSDTYYSFARLEGPEWYYLTTIPRDYLQRQAFASAKWVLWSGLFSLALALGSVALILRSQIARPLSDLARVTEAMSAGLTPEAPPRPRPDELGDLAISFWRMSTKVAARESELRQFNKELEHRVDERTTALARFAAIAEATSDLVGFSDMDGRIIYLNPAGKRIIGRSAEEPLDGLTLMDFVAPSCHPIVSQQLLPAAMQHGAASGEITLRRTDEGEVHVSIVEMIIRNAEGQPAYIAAIMRDEGERKQMLRDTERALFREREVSELRANFVSLISHEFRTPLEVILTGADILDRYFERLTPEKRLGYLRTIQESVKRMSGMMEDVLLLGRVEAGKLGFKPQPLDLPLFCRRVVDEMVSATSARCPIELLLEPDLPQACGDASLLRHVFVNLLSNAVKYSPEGAVVQLRVVQSGEDCLVTVIDRGRGIPDSDRARLFQSFQRGSNVTDTPGTGLGLLIVRKAVEIHGGRLSFQSEEGAGTQFHIVLPLFAPATSPKPSQT
ncbi:MAG TPA: ATP-binding protein [Candidatus Limnocylindria bacterium]|nr:ATP-binding protein [Candidatus Limnocylindria bacterium]